MSPQYDVYDFRGENPDIPDTFVSYVSGAFTSALGPAPDFRDGRGLAPAGWSMDAAGNTVFDARELFHWRATADDVVDFRGQTVPLTEVAVKPTAAFVDALAPTVDARSTDVPASLGAYAVNSVGDIVVDGRDLIYFGSTTSVPLEGRETVSP
jgi:hypothetical protein